jgi:hypothetical protein
MRTPDEVQVALIEHLKADAALLVLLGSSDKIKEVEWQGAEFTYPAVRVENDVMPDNIAPYCYPDGVNITIFCMSEKKSSKECQMVMKEVATYLHGHPFKATNGVSFVFIRVTKMPYPKQQEGMSIWTSPVEITAQVK